MLVPSFFINIYKLDTWRKKEETSSNYQTPVVKVPIFFGLAMACYLSSDLVTGNIGATSSASLGLPDENLVPLEVSGHSNDGYGNV